MNKTSAGWKVAWFVIGLLEAVAIGLTWHVLDRQQDLGDRLARIEGRLGVSAESDDHPTNRIAQIK